MDRLMVLFGLRGAGDVPYNVVRDRQPRTVPRRCNGKRQVLVIDESRYAWIKDPEEFEAIKKVVTAAAECKLGVATLQSISVKVDAVSCQYRVVATWVGSVGISDEDMDYVRQSSDMIEQVIISFSDSSKSVTRSTHLINTCVTILVTCKKLPATATIPDEEQSDSHGYMSAKKRRLNDEKEDSVAG